MIESNHLDKTKTTNKITIMTKKLSTLLTILFLLYGCASNKNIEQSQPIEYQSKEARINKVKKIQQWQINGKIAFIQQNERESASLFWLYDQSNEKQTLKLTTYLGINVLSLNSEKDIHAVEIDGENYQHENLDQLIYSLTGLMLPTKALPYWLKGLAFSDNDLVVYNENSGLPSKLTSFYQGNEWQINYKKYQRVDEVNLAHQFTIKQNNLTIKIVLNQWKL